MVRQATLVTLSAAIIFCALLAPEVCRADQIPSDPPCDEVRPPTDEHFAALHLVPACAATHIATESGRWSDPGIWSDRRVPTVGARVLIPARSSVEVDGDFSAFPLEWIRIDGILSYRNDTNTGLAATTLFVAHDAEFDIGTTASPIQSGMTAKLLITPRQNRDRARDPLDLAGGLLSEGKLTMVGATKTAHASLRSPAGAGASRLEFDQVTAGWRVGDRLLVPGSDASRDQDEVPIIAALDLDTRVVTLDRPLVFDHAAAPDIHGWIGNLTRNIEVRSVQVEPLFARGHVMVMHAGPGTLLDGAAFLGLGRTDTRRGHTVPMIGADGQVVPGSDDNTIGRYPVHFHLNGADITKPPQIVRNCVVVNGPKFGIVNHGSNVVVENNLTFRIAGSHLVAENGSEVGRFINNMAVRSSGSGDASILSRMGIYDNAHGGNGIWLTSGGVEVSGNWISGQADSGLKMLAMQFFERGREVFFDGRNIGMPSYADAAGRVALSDVDLSIKQNLISASRNGIEIWNHKEFATHPGRSVIDDNTIWNVQKHGIFLPYTRNTLVTHNRLFGSPHRLGCELCFNLVVGLLHRLPWSGETHERYCNAIGIAGNLATSNIEIASGRIEGFAVGIRMPQQGYDVVREVTLRNGVDIEVPEANVPDRLVHLANIDHESRNQPGSISIFMEALTPPLSGDVAVLFADDQIYSSEKGITRRLFFPTQSPSAVPFRDVGPFELRGRSTAQIAERFGLTLGGKLAPADATDIERSNALATTADSPPTRAALTDPNEWRQMLYDPHAPASEPAATTQMSEARLRWNGLLHQFEQLRRDGLLTTHRTHPKAMLYPTLLPTQIHPDDLPFGYRILLLVVDKVDGHVRVISHFEEFHDLTVDPDGYVRVSSHNAIFDGAGPLDIAIRVTPDAVRRGSNLDYFMQASYCGTCAADDIPALAARLVGSDS